MTEPSLSTLAAELMGLESARKCIQDRIDAITQQLTGHGPAPAAISQAKQDALAKARATLAARRAKKKR